MDTSKINLDSGYYNIHRSVVNYYRSLIPNNLEYYVVPFSIKKGSNIYGLIFGTHHLKGVYKFLLICWNQDPQRGEANFDIDKEKINPEKPSLFIEFNKPKKLLLYEKELQKKILNKELLTDKDVVIYSLINGFLPKHAKEIVSKLKKDNRINLSGGNFSEKTIANNYICKQIEIINV